MSGGTKGKLAWVTDGAGACPIGYRDYRHNTPENFLAMACRCFGHSRVVAKRLPLMFFEDSINIPLMEAALRNTRLITVGKVDSSWAEVCANTCRAMKNTIDEQVSIDTFDNAPSL